MLQDKFPPEVVHVPAVPSVYESLEDEELVLELELELDWQ
jgi:hypothetical protein